MVQGRVIHMNKNDLYAGKSETENGRFNSKLVGTSIKTDKTLSQMDLGYHKEDQDMKIWKMTNRRMATGNNRG